MGLFDVLLIAGGVIASIGVAPIVIGFGVGGVVAGSVAAGIQAGIGNVVAGSLFAGAQSLAATGVFGGVATAGAATTVVGAVMKIIFH